MDVVHGVRLDTSGGDPRERSIGSVALAIMFYWLIVPEILASASPSAPSIAPVASRMGDRSR